MPQPTRAVPRTSPRPWPKAHRSFPGGHFYPDGQSAAVVRVIATTLTTGALLDPAASDAAGRRRRIGPPPRPVGRLLLTPTAEPGATSGLRTSGPPPPPAPVSVLQKPVPPRSSPGSLSTGRGGGLPQGRLEVPGRLLALAAHGPSPRT
ncbi:hypothetical protein [Streptomyces sp. NPDC058664]|uniref:hypothetical protein n=1 Tax=unclassified Streptomyces TaxID=2593676 RepID=UPI00365266FF